MTDEGSDDQYQKAEILKAIRCYRNLHCPDYAVIFLYSPGGFYPFFIKPKHSGYYRWPFGDDEGKTNTGRSTKSDDQYQKAELLKAIRCYRNLHCPEYEVIFLYSPGGFYPFFIKPKQRLLLVAFRRRRRKNKYR